MVSWFRSRTIAVNGAMLDAICVAPGDAAEDDDIRLLVVNGKLVANIQGAGEVQ